MSTPRTLEQCMYVPVLRSEMVKIVGFYNYYYSVQRGLCILQPGVLLPF